MAHSPTTTTRPGDTLTPGDLGVGARLTVAVMDSDFAGIILEALAAADAVGLEIDTDSVSTLVCGDEQRVLEYICAVIAGAARGGHHVSATVLLSRGCPGEVTCATTPGLLNEAARVPFLAPSGIQATAHWALYPLDDTGSPNASPDHMRNIYAAIDYAKDRGTYVRGEHYVTRLEGDLAEVLGTVAAGWVMVGRSVQHVATHVTLSIASPTAV
ncbi:MAG: YkoF family thiamine/hydroxymethylpyrimidine-binding protein [Microbacteriaceae bacterium]